MNNLIPVATLKELGAIEHRINDATLSPRIKAACIRRSLDNLSETTPRKFHGIILRCRAALDAGDDLELISGIALIRSMIPIVYGMLTAGTAFKVDNGGYYIKRKNGIEEIHTSALFKHLPGNQTVRVINE